FLRRLADLGGGASEVVESEQRLDEVMDQIHRSVGTPVLTGLTVTAAGLDVIADTLVPSRLPDLFAGTPVVIAGRDRGAGVGAVGGNPGGGGGKVTKAVESPAGGGQAEALSVQAPRRRRPPRLRTEGARRPRSCKKCHRGETSPSERSRRVPRLRGRRNRPVP